MNIGIVTHVINEHSGAKAPIKLAEALKKKGQEVTIYSFDSLLDQAVLERLSAEGIKVVTLSVPPVPFISDLISFWKFWGILKQAKHQVLSVHAKWSLVIAAKLSGSFTVTTYYGTQLSLEGIEEAVGLLKNRSLLSLSRLFDLLVKIQQKIIFLFSDKSVALSSFLSEEALKLYNQKIPYIYLGAETEFTNLRAANKDNEQFILSVSRIVPYKGFDKLIRAFLLLNREFPSWQLRIVGSVADKQYLETLNQLKNNQVQIILNPTDWELALLYQGCSIYATYDLWVPWSLTPLEASYFSKPLLGLKRGSMPEIIIDEKNGFLANNFEDYVTVLRKLIVDRGLREVLGKQALQLVKGRFSWDKTAENYLKVFQREV